MAASYLALPLPSMTSCQDIPGFRFVYRPVAEARPERRLRRAHGCLVLGAAAAHNLYLRSGQTAMPLPYAYPKCS